MKPAIILFTTLTFITTLSVFIMQQLSNNENLLQEHSYEQNNTQSFILVNNLKDEIGKILLKNKDNLYDLNLLNKDNNFEYKGLKVSFIIEEYTPQFNMNDIFKKNDTQKIKDFFQKNNYDFDNFSYFINEYFSAYDKKDISLTNTKQVMKILEVYQRQEQLENIDILKINFTYFDINKEANYYRCFLKINIENKNYKSSFVYSDKELNENNIKVKDFEITVT